MKPADLLFVGGDWGIADLISYFTRHRGEPPTKVHHIAGMVNHITVEEALLKVEKSLFSDGDRKHNYYQIGRNTYLTDIQRYNIANNTRSYTNNFYGGGKLLFHMMDGILGKFFYRDIFAFRSLLTSKQYPICSGLWAYSYYDVMGYEFGHPANVVSPDDMHDHVKKSEQGEMLYEKWG